MGKKQVPSMVKDEKLIERRREQMIKASVMLFSKKGFHRTTTREIARESGFSIGTLYEYIRSKEDILYLVCDSIYERVSRRLQQEMDHDFPTMDSLEKAISGFLKVMDDLQDEVLVMYQESHDLSKEALPYVLTKELEMTAMFEDILTRCVEAGELQLSADEVSMAAHNILVCGQMWTFRRWVLAKSYTIEQYAQLQIPYILRGVKAKNPAAINV